MRVDVLVAGAGPAGLAAAWTLARGGTRVLVVDRGLARPPLGEGLPPAATPVLQELELWERFLHGTHTPSYGNRSLWGSPRPVEANFIQQPYGNGWRLDRPAFERMLLEAVRECGVMMWSGARVTSWGPNRQGGWAANVALPGGIQRVDAAILLDATGRSRQIVRGMGAPRQTYDRAVAIVGTLAASASSDADTATLIEAVPDGWWYAVTSPGGRLVLGFVTDADTEAARRARTAQGWAAALSTTTAIRHRMQRSEACLPEALAIVAAESSHLPQSAGDGWCAVGDAAAAHDPLSSRGITAALMSGKRAGEAILASNGGALDAYAAWMQESYARYLAEWLAHYETERRWPHSPFWQRRHAILEALIG